MSVVLFRVLLLRRKIWCSLARSEYVKVRGYRVASELSLRVMRSIRLLEQYKMQKNMICSMLLLVTPNKAKALGRNLERSVM